MEARLAPLPRSAISPTLEIILKAVAYRTFDDGPCVCGEAGLAERAKVSARTIRWQLLRAERLGLVRRERNCRQFGNGRGRANDKIIIVGHNDLKPADQADMLTDKSTSGLTGQLRTTNRTGQSDQPDTKGVAYKEAIKDKKTISLPSPSVCLSSGGATSAAGTVGAMLGKTQRLVTQTAAKMALFGKRTEAPVQIPCSTNDPKLDDALNRGIELRRARESRRTQQSKINPVGAA